MTSPTNSESLREQIDTWVAQAYVNGNLDTYVDFDKDKQGYATCTDLILERLEAEYQKRENALLDELEHLTQGTVCLYHHAQGERGTGLGCGCTTEIDREALESWLTAHRQDSKKGEEDE